MAIGKSFIAITISLQEIFATNDFVPLIIRCFATIKFSEFCIIAPNHQNQGISLNVFLKLKKLKLKIITIVIEFLSSCFVEVSSRPYKIVKDSLSDFCATVFDMFIVKCIHFFVSCSVLQQIFIRRAKILFNFDITLSALRVPYRFYSV